MKNCLQEVDNVFCVEICFEKIMHLKKITKKHFKIILKTIRVAEDEFHEPVNIYLYNIQFIFQEFFIKNVHFCRLLLLLML